MAKIEERSFYRIGEQEKPQSQIAILAFSQPFRDSLIRGNAVAIAMSSAIFGLRNVVRSAE
ncbi:MAG: hypothetical protein D6728_16220, partial [Cyanobacteria bacterium J055]